MVIFPRLVESVQILRAYFLMRGSHAQELRIVAPFVVRIRSAHLGDGPRNFDFLRTVTTNSKQFWAIYGGKEDLRMCHGSLKKFHALI